MDINRRHKNLERRCRLLKKGARGEGPIVYWLARDQRVNDNWALLWAQQEAIARQKGLLVVFCLASNYFETRSRQYGFMLKGLAEIQEKLHELNIHFIILEGAPELVLQGFLREIEAHLLVCDFDPLRRKRQWNEQLINQVEFPIYEVDAHNIIPAWAVSDKKEYGAYTIRPKIKRLLDDYLTDFPTIKHHPFHWKNKSTLPHSSCLLESVSHSSSNNDQQLEAGESNAQRAADSFINTGLADYSENRNNPCLNGQSGLSPYLHFGHLSAQRLAYTVSKNKLPSETKEAFLEELIVRRELSDNFCLYEPLYDTFAGFPDWARKTHDLHRGDKREYVYSLDELESGKTHEQLWNACQLDLVQSSKLHGFLRMYWAKKILEWTPAPEIAVNYAITLNDRYSLDGHDPNGYAGVAWSIGGVHDRAWGERPVFGKVRYMNEAGCRRKFDVNGYIKSILGTEKT